ncbi:MAG: sulfotransferase family 2 domain-containing protein [Sneathiella sp.]|nr:sulfotransferase family 2 domain-containing protein [Sneathiella sp.]
MFWKHRNRIVFFHIPKCAGTSVYRSLAHTLSDRTPLDKLLYRHRLTIIHDDWHKKRRTQKLRRARRSRFVTGHFEWSTYKEINPQPDDFLFTFLRNPKDRLLSLFRYLSDPQGSKWLEKRGVSSTNIIDFFETGHPHINWQIDNVMVRTFAGKYAEPLNTSAEWNEALQIAKRNLSKLDFIGNNVSFDKDLSFLSHRLELPLNKDTTQENKSTISRDNFLVTQELEEILSPRHRYDDLLYDYALKI